jgi:hypothetical protein
MSTMLLMSRRLHALNIERDWDRGILVVEKLQGPSEKKQRQGEFGALSTQHGLNDIRQLHQKG